MNAVAPPTPKPRWRWKNFSLRTLMIGVLLIAFSWTATAVWGVARIKSDIEKMDRDSRVSEFQAHASAPFLVRCQFNLHRPVGSGTAHQHFSETYFWFFGFEMRVYSNESNP